MHPRIQRIALSSLATLTLLAAFPVMGTADDIVWGGAGGDAGGVGGGGGSAVGGGAGGGGGGTSGDIMKITDKCPKGNSMWVWNTLVMTNPNANTLRTNLWPYNPTGSVFVVPTYAPTFVHAKYPWKYNGKTYIPAWSCLGSPTFAPQAPPQPASAWGFGGGVSSVGGSLSSGGDYLAGNLVTATTTASNQTPDCTGFSGTAKKIAISGYHSAGSCTVYPPSKDPFPFATIPGTSTKCFAGWQVRVTFDGSTQWNWGDSTTSTSPTGTATHLYRGVSGTALGGPTAGVIQKASQSYTVEQRIFIGCAVGAWTAWTLDGSGTVTFTPNGPHMIYQLEAIGQAPQH